MLVQINPVNDRNDRADKLTTRAAFCCNLPHIRQTAIRTREPPSTNVTTWNAVVLLTRSTARPQVRNKPIKTQKIRQSVAATGSQMALAPSKIQDTDRAIE